MQISENDLANEKLAIYYYGSTSIVTNAGKKVSGYPITSFFTTPEEVTNALTKYSGNHKNLKVARVENLI